ncbi:hypothetical protein [Paenibacillus sp. MBLB4367]|uniref:hypothetical protein n=1 Tax=Paenibacillus sp. MBLB4367 TaxID=3384767 RepID=UPI003907F456
MKKYEAPIIIEYGKSKDLIKGNCSWGAENWTLDLTDWYHYDWYHCYMNNCVVDTLCVPLGHGNEDTCAVHNDCN